MAHKYKAIKTQASDGKWFPSKKEAFRYECLLLLQRGGAIKDLKCQVKMPVEIKGKYVFTYIADFVYWDLKIPDVPVLIYEDVKGYKTQTYKLKKRCVEAYYHCKITET